MIKLIFTINELINSVWLALVDPEIIRDWSGAPATMSDAEGARFSLWGGDIYGTNLKVLEPTTLIQEWYANDWQQPSRVVINLEEVGLGETRIYLEHSGVPFEQEQEFSAGWDTYYFGPIKALLESRDKMA